VELDLGDESEFSGLYGFGDDAIVGRPVLDGDVL
jgi:hypothetical protein